jgi:N6-adenosine-specific RNA methylase IME4
MEHAELLFAEIGGGDRRLEPYSRKTGMDRAADNHYPTMTLDQIKALNPPAAKNCVLLLWVTQPMLRAGIEVMDTWGFEYKSTCIWAKHRVGTGHWFRNKHEQLLVGVKGDIPAPAAGEQFVSLIEALAGRHSQKPEAFAEMITEYFPTMLKLEMFYRVEDDPEVERARRAWRERAGWKLWGNEAG